MSFQFSLRRLLIGVTVVCILCAWATYLPEEYLAYALIAGLFVPTVVVCLVLVGLAHRRKFVLLLSLIGAAFGTLLVEPAGVMGSTTTVWPYIQNMVLPMVIFPPLGAVLLGGGVVLDDLWRKRSEH